VSPNPAVAAARTPVTSGLIEAIGLAAQRSLFISGWSRSRLADGATVTVYAGRQRVLGRLWLVRSDRPDVGHDAGFCGVIDLEADLDPKDLAVVVLDDEAVLRPYDSMKVIDEKQCVALLRVAAGTAKDGSVRAKLERVASPFDGSDTVGSSRLPVRVGIDDCVALGGGNLLLRGWVYDPEALAAAVTVAAGHSETRIDTIWVGQPRPDVTHAMSSMPLALTHDVHGFTVVVPSIGAGPLHLRLDLRDGERLHMPLSARSGATRVLLRQLVMALDPEVPGTLDVLERMVVPALAASVDPKPGIARFEGGPPQANEPLGLVIGCAGDCGDVDAALHVIAANPSLARLHLIIAADGRELSSHAGDIARRAAFLGLRLQQVFGRGVLDPLDALTIGATAAATRSICLATVPGLATLPSDCVLPEALKTPSWVSGDDGARTSVLVVQREAFLAAGGFSTLRLSESGKWQALLAAIGAADVAIPPFGGSVRSEPWVRSLEHVDRCVAAIQRQNTRD
jgi:hypothetical protein